jgi:PAS domain S-box-containing protein
MTTERVLVVDDEQGFCDLMMVHLQRHGYEVEVAFNGVEALDKLQNSEPFAVLVTDLTMPVMGGLELLRESRKRYPQMEVVVLTANDTVEAAIAALREYGAYDYLTKPLSSNNELSMAVARAAVYRRLRLERENLQAQLIAQAKRLQALIANTTDAIVAADARNIIVVANPAASRLLGQVNLVGTDALTHLPKPLASLVQNWLTIGDQQPAQVEMPWAGDAMQLVNLNPVATAGERTEGWVMVVHDITHLHRLDELKMRLLTEAANKIQIPLIQALTDLAELSQIQELKSGRPSETIYRLVKLLSRIQTWMEDVLMQGRIEAGLGIQPTTLEVPALVRLWKDTLPEDQPLPLTLKIEEAIPPVYADRDLMLRLFEHMYNQVLGNVKPEMGGQWFMSVKHQAGQVWVEASYEGQGMRRKTGPLRLPRRVRPGEEDDASLEMDLIKAIISRMGGQVWVRGHDDFGSSIAICLPAVTETEEK